MPGINDREEVNVNRIRRDSRTAFEVIGDVLHSKDVGLAVMAIAFTALLMPGVGQIALIPVILIGIFNLSRRNEEAPLYLPKTSGMDDIAYAHPGTGKARPAAGIAFMGNEEGTNREVWVPNDVERAHILYLATTGGGKSEGLKSFAMGGPLLQGSGYIYIDGKGENKLALSLLSMARRVGREDDFFVISFMTGNQDIMSRSTTVTTNTFNPFVYGSSAVISELLKSLLSSDSGSGGADMWRSRAESYVDAIVRPLVFLRDTGAIQMTVGEFRNALNLQGVAELFRKLRIAEAKRKAEGGYMPVSVVKGLMSYLNTLPGLTAPQVQQIVDTGSLPKLGATVYDQHGYISMQLTPVVNMLADDYGHIFNCRQSDIDMWDIVTNRRQLVVLLPALEKSPGALSNLGKIVLAAIKSMMGMALGHYVEGKTDELLEYRPTDSPSPMKVFADEVGYYFVDGIAITAAQARSLGFSFLYAGQDYPALKRGSEKEAPSVVGNTGIKIFGKLEDAEDTLKIAQSRLAKGWTSETSGREYDEGLAGTGVYDQKGLRYEERERITIRDLSKLKEGQVYIIHADKKVRVNLFYADAAMVRESRLNTFQQVLPPPDDVIESVSSGGEATAKRLSDSIQAKRFDVDPNSGKDDNIAHFTSLYRSAQNNGARLLPAAMAALGAYDQVYGTVIRTLNVGINAVNPETEAPDKPITPKQRRTINDRTIRQRAARLSQERKAQGDGEVFDEAEDKRQQAKIVSRLSSMGSKVITKAKEMNPVKSGDDKTTAGLFIGNGEEGVTDLDVDKEVEKAIARQLAGDVDDIVRDVAEEADGDDDGSADSVLAPPSLNEIKATADDFKQENSTQEGDGDGGLDSKTLENKVPGLEISRESNLIRERARLEAQFLVRKVRDNGAHPRRPHPKADKERLKATLESLSKS